MATDMTNNTTQQHQAGHVGTAHPPSPLHGRGGPPGVPPGSRGSIDKQAHCEFFRFAAELAHINALIALIHLPAFICVARFAPVVPAGTVHAQANLPPWCWC